MHLNLTISQKLKLFINTQTYTHVFFLDSNENNNAQKKKLSYICSVSDEFN